MKCTLLTLLFFETLCMAEDPSSTSHEKVDSAIVPSYNRLESADYDYDPLYRDEETIKREKEEKEAYERKQKEQKAEAKAQNAKNREQQKKLQKQNKEAYDKAMKEFEKRRDKKIKKQSTENSIIISDKPI